MSIWILKKHLSLFDLQITKDKNEGETVWWMNFQLLPNVEILNMCKFREWDLRKSKNQMLNKLYSTSMAMSTSLCQIEYSGVILFALISMAKCFMHRHTCLNLPGVCEIRIQPPMSCIIKTYQSNPFFFYPMDPKVASQTVQFSFFNFYWTNKFQVYATFTWRPFVSYTLPWANFFFIWSDIHCLIGT